MAWRYGKVERHNSAAQLVVWQIEARQHTLAHSSSSCREGWQLFLCRSQKAAFRMMAGSIASRSLNRSRPCPSPSTLSHSSVASKSHSSAKAACQDLKCHAWLKWCSTIMDKDRCQCTCEVRDRGLGGYGSSPPRGTPPLDKSHGGHRVASKPASRIAILLKL